MDEEYEKQRDKLDILMSSTVLRLHQALTHLLRPSPILLLVLLLAPALDSPPVPVPFLFPVLDIVTGSGSDFEVDLFCCAVRGKKWKGRTETCQIPEPMQWR